MILQISSARVAVLFLFRLCSASLIFVFGSAAFLFLLEAAVQYVAAASKAAGYNMYATIYVVVASRAA